MANKLYYFYGAMGSAKTLRLLSTAYNFEEKGIGFLCLKPSIDTRDGENKIHSRAGLERECITISPSDDLYDLVLSKGESVKKILIDECQFLTSGQVQQLTAVVDKLNIDVMCYGLRTDFKGELFEGSQALFEIADTIEEVKSHCSCGRKAIMNARIDENGDFIFSGNKIHIGGNESYKPLCRKCYNELAEQTLQKIIQENNERIKNNINETSN